MRFLRRRPWRRHHWNLLTGRGWTIVVVLGGGMTVLALVLAGG